MVWDGNREQRSGVRSDSIRSAVSTRSARPATSTFNSRAAGFVPRNATTSKPSSHHYAHQHAAATPRPGEGVWSPHQVRKSSIMRPPTRGVSVLTRIDENGIAGGFGQLNTREKSYNPSMGPAPSVHTMNRGFSNSMVKANRSGVCKLSVKTSNDFKPGQIISVPHHCANMNPHVNPKTDFRWTQTAEGPVYSKRRMMVILWILGEEMFFVPMYSNGGHGITTRRIQLQDRKYYVCVANVGDEGFVNEGVHPPVAVKMMWKPMTRKTIIHIIGGRSAQCCEDI